MATVKNTKLVKTSGQARIKAMYKHMKSQPFKLAQKRYNRNSGRGA